MTIFESEMIVYAAYHILSDELAHVRYGCPLHNYINCPAGRAWLANIEKVEFI